MVNATNYVEITLNSELYSAVKNSLQTQGISASYSSTNKTITISETALSSVTYLDLSNSSIDDLTGLSSFYNVTELNLTANELTVDSNLSELDSLSLTNLNLSSNKLESVSSISTFDSIAYTDITNQELTSKEIITVDTSDDSDHTKTYTIYLPDILLEDTGTIDADWIDSEVSGDAYVNWSSINGSTLTLTVASGSGDSYSALKGLITITVNVKDSSSKIANTKMTLYYVVIDSDETGILFNDEYLYNAVKSQLTAGQTENNELESYGKSGETLYSRAYDDALILVIDTNTLINKIPSLILNDKRITDLTGLEEFVGLDTELNLSYNYIDSIEKIIELDENKEAKEAELQEKYQKYLTNLASYRSSLKSALEEYDSLSESYGGSNLTETEKESIAQSMTSTASTISTYRTLISNTLEKLYDIYENEYLLTTILPADIITLSYDDIYDADKETIKTYAESIMDEVSTLEEDGALTDWEIDIIIDAFGIPTTTLVEGVEVTIENPITSYFNTLKEGADLLNIDDYESFVYNMKVIDSIIVAGNYCLLENMYNGETNCVLSSAFDIYISDLDLIDLDTTFAEIAKSNYLSYTSGCMCDILDTNDVEEVEEIISGKFANETSDIVGLFVKLPRLKNLNLEDNSIESLAGLEELEELETLNVYKNLLDDINDVDWSCLTSITNLNLGYNQLTDVNCLEVLVNLQTLDLTRNLLSGSFDFYLAGMEDLTYADFSYNQISDIAYFTNQFKFLAKAVNMNVEDYVLSSYCPTVKFQYQTLTISTTAQLDDTFITIELPSIFEQAENIDYSRTSFGIDSLLGTVEADGTTVKLYTPSTGSYTATVKIEGYNGNSYTTNGIAYGTTCTINYEIVDSTDNEEQNNNNTTTTATVTLDPDTVSAGGSSTMTYTYSGDSIDADSVVINWTVSGNTSASTTIVEQSEVVSSSTEVYEKAIFTWGEDETAEEITVTAQVEGDDTSVVTVVWTLTEDDAQADVNLTYGYTVSDGYIYVNTPEMTVSTFASNLLTDNDEYVINVTNSEDALNGYIATGAVVTIDDEDENTVAALEVVVLGDVNGDGEVDAIDSGIVRNVRSETTTLVGSYYEAADVNQDDDIDYLDSLQILYYRAEKISSF